LKLLDELIEHPATGTGKPEKMKYADCYSRRITKKHRLVYSIDNDKIVVLVLSASGHNDDK
jgi:toxin YoeB